MLKNKSKIKSYKFGNISEAIVRFYLRIKFYKIIEKNFKTKFAEIDIIALKKNMLVFIEVKARKNKLNFYEVLTNNQQINICKCANFYLSYNNKLASLPCRFDLITYCPPFKISHHKDAWQVTK